VDLSQNPLWKKIRGKVGKRFTRFIPVAIASLVASQVALIVFNHGVHLTAGIAGFLAAVIGAAVSYVLSRWAWERKGRPDLLRETLPFWAVSVCVWIILAWANKLGVYLVHDMGLHKGWKKIIVENGTYFGFNCVTFVIRFLIFHYVLFADRGAAAAGSPESESLTLASTGDDPTRGLPTRWRSRHQVP
jgi:putative flippase GtrA